MRGWTEAQSEIARTMRADGKPWDEIGRAIGKTGHAVRQRFKDAPLPVADVTGESLRFEESGEQSQLSGGIRKRIVTLEDALEAGNVDQKVWRVKSYEITKWEMGFKDAEKKPGYIPLWRIKVSLERIHKKCYTDSLPLLFGTLKGLRHKPTKPKITGERLFVPCLFDTHLGKYAWAEETGTDQDTTIQANVYRNAMTDLIAMSGGDFERVMFPIGNDFFQVNNWLNTTAKGTHVDHDGRFQKVFHVGCLEVIGAIEKCLEVAPVDVLWIPGNHDPEPSYALALVMWAYFHTDKNVRVDFGPSGRKYYRYGKTLIGLTHGDKEKMQDLPALMPSERAMDFAETSTHEWLMGHTHRKRGYVAKDSEETMGVRMRVIPSLSGTDSWHHGQAYVGCHRAAEAYVYGREAGYMGHWSVGARG